MAIAPRAFAARDLPGRSRFAPVVEELVALFPAQNKPDVMLEHQLQPRTAGKATIPDLHDPTPPAGYGLVKQVLQFGPFITGTLAAPGPPARGCQYRWTLAPEDEQTKPVQTRNTDWATTRRLEEARTDAFEAASLAGTHGTQVVIVDRLRLFQHAAVPNQEGLFASLKQDLNTCLSLLPEPVGNQFASPAWRAQQVAQPLGASRRLLGSNQVGTKLREEQAVRAVAPLNDRDQRGQEGADQAAVELLVEGAQERSKEADKMTGETVSCQGRRLRG